MAVQELKLLQAKLWKSSLYKRRKAYKQYLFLIIGILFVSCTSENINDINKQNDGFTKVENASVIYDSLKIVSKKTNTVIEYLCDIQEWKLDTVVNNFKWQIEYNCLEDSAIISEDVLYNINTGENIKYGFSNYDIKVKLLDSKNNIVLDTIINKYSFQAYIKNQEFLNNAVLILRKDFIISKNRTKLFLVIGYPRSDYLVDIIMDIDNKGKITISDIKSR